MNRCTSIVALTVLFLTAGLAQAADLTPLLTTRGKSLLNESFDGEKLSDQWESKKGTWIVAKGALKGSEKASDEHAAVIGTSVELPAAFQIQFDFKFDGAKATHLSFNGKGHICRVSLTPTGFTLKGEKVKKDPKDKAVTVGQIQQTFEQGKWYTMLVEVDGPQFVAFVDPKHVAFGTHEKVARDKNVVRFPLSGSTASFDNLKIWAAQSNPKWAETKAALPTNKIIPPTPPTPAARFKRGDRDGDGKISQSEFVSPRPKDKQEAATKAFKRKDKDGNGFLDVKEFAPPAKKKPAKAKDV
jgi:hypothetical protein